MISPVPFSLSTLIRSSRILSQNLTCPATVQRSISSSNTRIALSRRSWSISVPSFDHKISLTSPYYTPRRHRSSLYGHFWPRVIIGIDGWHISCFVSCTLVFVCSSFHCITIAVAWAQLSSTIPLNIKQEACVRGGWDSARGLIKTICCGALRILCCAV